MRHIESSIVDLEFKRVFSWQPVSEIHRYFPEMVLDKIKLGYHKTFRQRDIRVTSGASLC